MKEGSAMTEILAIDDDREILAVIKKALLREGYQVTALEDPLQLEEDKLGRYQLILLDVMMPGIDGFDLCRRIREKVDCPILFLTAKTEEKDVMTGLGAGGDDYITKPFGIGELRARVAAHRFFSPAWKNAPPRYRSYAFFPCFQCRREKSMCRNMNLFLQRRNIRSANFWH